MYLGYEKEAATANVKTVADLAPPPKATHCEIMAETQHVRYRMDDPNQGVIDQTTGMLLLTTEGPKAFLIEDLKRIRFTRATGTDGVLHIHYFGGRDI